MPESPDDRVWMAHPALTGRPQEVFRRQFDLVWKQHGWTLCDPPSADETPRGPEPDAPTGRARTRKAPTDTAPADAAAETPKEN